ncbi:PA2778 family cysteine peptidase [Pseudohaliea rubra]|uniref:Peptidase C39-like domain-containing protein n=1 Tax=Pseudohaliea rubra DSM 19751 TaxID=1265313 RepID=A0A095XSX1_9GAMM|nr:PA2778 family cysteine peptidase [Pseudohaliea rubra]KGE02766.1 hypothetical protein HRUBRA_02744 [Pseudohaliea rubra DSM 19751]
MRPAAVFSLLLTLVAGCSLSPARPPAGADASVELAAVPFFPQARYQCGPAALATVLAATSLPVTADALVDAVYLPGREGSLQAELAAAARRHGRVPFPVAASEEALVAELSAGHPVLILQNLGLDSLPRWHYAVVVGYRVDTAQWVLRSGRERRRLEGVRAFRRHWEGGARWGLVVLPPGQLPAVATPRVVAGSLAAAEPLLGAGATLAGWEAALARWPADADLAFGAGNSFRAAELPGEAFIHYQRALAIDPQHAATRNNLADLLLAQGCAGQARAALAPALKAVGADDPLGPVLAATAQQIEVAAGGSCKLPGDLAAE